MINVGNIAKKSFEAIYLKDPFNYILIDVIAYTAVNEENLNVLKNGQHTLTMVFQKILMFKSR